MESSPEVRSRKGVGILWVLVLMIASFSGGVFVGLNPSRIPAVIGLPTHGITSDTEEPHPHVLPSTEPSTEPMSDTTQPAPPMR